MFNGRVSGNGLKGAGEGDRWTLRGPAGRVVIDADEFVMGELLVVVDVDYDEQGRCRG